MVYMQCDVRSESGKGLERRLPPYFACQNDFCRLTQVPCNATRRVIPPVFRDISPPKERSPPLSPKKAAARKKTDEVLQQPSLSTTPEPGKDGASPAGNGNGTGNGHVPAAPAGATAPHFSGATVTGAPIPAALRPPPPPAIGADAHPLPQVTRLNLSDLGSVALIVVC